MKKFAALTIIFLAFFLSVKISSAAENLNYAIDYDIEIKLFENTAFEKISIGINNTGNLSIDEFAYSLPENAVNTNVYDGGLELNYTQEIADKKIIHAGLVRAIAPQEYRNIAIEFEVSELITKAGEEYIFSALFSPPKYTSSFLISLTLPEGTSLSKKIEEGAAVAPLPKNVKSDGKSIILEWEPSPREKFAVFATYSKNVEQSSAKLYAASVFLLLSFSLLIYFTKRKRPRIEKSMTSFDYLKEDEKLVISLVKGAPGITQKKIAEATNYSESKISKVIAELEKRGIVRTERIGRKNKVFLDENFEKTLK